MLMNTAQSIDEHLRKSKDAKEDVTDSDDVALFFKSLVPRFKRLSQNAKSCVRLQIEQTFFNAECSYPGMNEVDSPHMKTGSWNTSGYRKCMTIVNMLCHQHSIRDLQQSIHHKVMYSMQASIMISFCWHTVVFQTVQWPKRLTF